MHKHSPSYTARGLIMLVLSFLLGLLLLLYMRSVRPLPDGRVERGPYADGEYTASAHGCLSDIAVSLRIRNGHIVSVSADASGETPELGGKAAEQLAAAILSADGTDGVDGVSGSTLSSEAVLTAAGECLRQAS